MVIPEAMAAGLVVIASDHVGPRTILAKGGGIMVEEGNVDAIAVHIARLRNDPALWEQLSSASRRNAREYSVSELGGKWQQIFEFVSGAKLDGKEAVPGDRPLDADAPAGRVSPGDGAQDKAARERCVGALIHAQAWRSSGRAQSSLAVD